MGDDGRGRDAPRSELMRRGDVVWVDLDPVRGGEANNRRPAVVVSNDGANRTAETLGRGVVTVVPITSATERVYPFQVLLPAKACGLPRRSKAQAEQVRSITVQRVGETVGRLSAALLAELDDALRLHLDL
jgi:mRNA interferase MazF